MSYKVLEQNGVLNENIDGAAFNNFCAKNMDGIIGDVLEECPMYLSSSNIISIGSGLLIIKGFRVKILEDGLHFSIPSGTTPGVTQIICSLTLNKDRSVLTEISLSEERVLKQDSILTEEEGKYEVEIGRFYWDGSSAKNLTRSISVISVDQKAEENIELAQTLSGNEENKAPSVKAVNEGLAGKVDSIIIPQNDPNYYAYAVNKNGASHVLLSGVSNSNGTVPQYGRVENSNYKDKGGTINVTTPVYDYNAANKKYVDEGLAQLEKHVDDSVSNLEEVLGAEYKIGNEAFSGMPITLPEGHLPYAYLNKLSDFQICGTAKNIFLSNLVCEDDSGATISIESNEISIASTEGWFDSYFTIQPCELHSGDTVFFSVKIEEGTALPEDLIVLLMDTESGELLTAEFTEEKMFVGNSVLYKYDIEQDCVLDLFEITHSDIDETNFKISLALGEYFYIPDWNSTPQSVFGYPNEYGGWQLVSGFKDFKKVTFNVDGKEHNAVDCGCFINSSDDNFVYNYVDYEKNEMVVRLAREKQSSNSYSSYVTVLDKEIRIPFEELRDTGVEIGQPWREIRVGECTKIDFGFGFDHDNNLIYRNFPIDCELTYIKKRGV